MEATLNEMRCMQETVCREVQDVTELETARSALNAQLVASSEELATLVPPSTLGDALQAELEVKTVCISLFAPFLTSWSLQGELETAQLALKEELHGAMLTELEEIRGCREKVTSHHIRFCPLTVSHSCGCAVGSCRTGRPAERR